MLPLAPVRLSTSQVCPIVSLSLVARTRASVSTPPPTPKPATSRTGREGYAGSAAWASAQIPARASEASVLANRRIGVAMSGLLLECAVYPVRPVQRLRVGAQAGRHTRFRRQLSRSYFRQGS